MPEPYRPSNGSEGMGFEDKWCAICERDRVFREDWDKSDGCQINAMALMFDINDDKYPVEWIYNKVGKPCCTSFKKIKTDEERKRERNTANRRKMESAGQLRMFL